MESLFYPLLLLIPFAILSHMESALRFLGRFKGNEFLKNRERTGMLFRIARTGGSHYFETLQSSVAFGKIGYLVIFLISPFLLPIPSLSRFSKEIVGILLSAELALISLILEYTTYRFIEKNPEKSISRLTFPSTVCLLPYFPFLWFRFRFLRPFRFRPSSPSSLPFRPEDGIMEYLNESDVGRYLDGTDKKLIHTVLAFKNRIVREVMVPRIDIFGLPVETTIREAVRFFSEEGYSRIPVYKESVDKIVGVLLYKDLLSIYTKHLENNDPASDLQKTIEHLIKPALYTPETKKIAGLLQEFRSKQIHLAIVVDEYGGTEGIVTIEDILEVLVGEIEDEYDTQEPKTYTPLPSGGWMVDAKIGIIALEEELGIKIPQNPEYDTLGGFLFHRAGSIPDRGWKIHLDTVDLEVVSTDDRSVRQVKITPASFREKKHS